MVKFFSRNAINYTHIYGPKMAPLILENVDVQAAVLDGEMIVWDKENQTMAPFGLNKNVAGTEDNERFHLCYKIFDILFVKRKGDESQEIDLMGAFLKERK